MSRKIEEKLARESLTCEQLEQLTVTELVKLALTDVEYARLKEIKQVRDRERAERVTRLRIEAEPILADLREVGFDVKFVHNVKASKNYAQAVPILLRHLILPYSDSTRDDIARALAVRSPQVRKAWPILVEEYRRAPMGRGIVAPGDNKEFPLHAKDGLACALTAAVTDETLQEFIDLVKDRSHGGSRVLLLSVLRRSKSPLAKQALEELKDDPDLKKEIASWRKRKC